MAKAVIRKRYRHYKGYEYEVLAIGHDEETLIEVVIYKALYDTEDFGPEPVWVRLRFSFEEQIKFEGKLIDRFTEI